MINTKCSECMFASPIINGDVSTGCSKNIIDNIKDYKKIIQDINNFNILEEYACRYGFSKKIYEEHKQKFEEGNFEQMLHNNTLMRYYLFLDVSDSSLNFDQILDQISGLCVPPRAISLMFRFPSFRPFIPSKHTHIMDNMYSDLKWKAHNFLDKISLQDAIDNIIPTNTQANNTTHFLVYSANELDSINQDIQVINNNLILYQKQMIAMVKNLDSLNNLFISFENYSVAKSINSSIVEAIKTESNILYY